MTERILVMLLAGCASSSIAEDIQRVQELTRAAKLADVAGAVDPATSSDVRTMLRDPLDAERAVQIALLNNRELRAELRSLGIARGELIQAGLIPNPVFEVEALPERETQLELRVEYDLTALVLVPLKKQVAEADLEARRKRAAGAVLELGYLARSSFYMLQAAEQRLAIANRSLDAFAAARDAAQALLEAGNVPAIEALGPITAYERARVIVAELELEEAAQRERMHRVLGLFGEDTAWRTAGELAVVPEALAVPDQIETKAIEGSMELAEMESRLEMIAHQTSVSRTEGWFPDVEIDVHSLFGHPDEEIQPLWRFGAGVSVALPLFDRQQGVTQSHEAEFDSESERMQAIAIDVRSAARSARARLISAHARARQYQSQILPAQKRVVDQTLLQYNAMQIGVFEVLEAQRDALDFELEAVGAQLDYWSAKAALDTLLAGRMVMSGGG